MISKKDNFVFKSLSYCEINLKNSCGINGAKVFDAISFSWWSYSEVYIVEILDFAASDKFLMPVKLDIEMTLN